MHESHRSPSAAASSPRSTIATAPISDRNVKRRTRSDSSTSGRGRSSTAVTADPDTLIEQPKKDEAITEADTLLLTVPNQLGVAYNAHVIESILTHVAPALGWR